MAKSKKARTQEVIAILARTYGTFRHVPAAAVGSDGKLLTAMLFSALGEGRETGASNAAAGLEALRAGYLDFNEVRVSTIAELEATLKHAGVPQPRRRAQAVKATLEDIYQKYNLLSVQSVESIDAKNREKAMRRLRLADPAAVEAGLLYGLDPAIVSAGPPLQRVAKRLGLGETDNPARLVKMVAPEQSGAKLAWALHAYAVIAADHCVTKDPLCETCPLLPTCEFGPQELDRRDKARIAAEKKRQADEEKERKKLARMHHMKDAATKRRALPVLPSAAAGSSAKGSKGSGSKPTSAGKKPGDAAKAAPGGTKASTAAGKASAVAQKPPAGKKPTAAGKKPTAAGKKPTAAGKKPTAAGKKPTAAGKKPTAAGKKPTATGKRPTLAGKKPTPGSAKPAKKSAAAAKPKRAK